MGRSSVPRQHHYVPEAYLAGFTLDGQRETKLWVTDLVERRQYQVVPKKTGKERDFYTVDRQDSGDPHAVETWLAEHIDSHGARVLKEIEAAGMLPTGKKYEWLMGFLATMALRGTFFRKRINNFTERVTKGMLGQVGRNDASFKDFLSLIPEEIKKKKEFSEEGLRELIRSEEYDLSLEQTFLIGLMLDMVPKLGAALGQRSWHLMRVVDPTVHLVCSDQPVSLVPKIPMPLPIGPGFGMRETLAYFPVNRDWALVGSFEGEAQPRILHADAVARINAATASHALRYVYSATKEFTWLDRDAQVRRAEDFLALDRVSPAAPPETL